MERSDGIQDRDATTLDHIVALLTGLSLICVFMLPSQSGASFPTYLLALIVLIGGRDRWRAFFGARPLPLLMVALLVYFSSSVWWSDEYSARGAFSVYSRCVLILTFVVALSASLGRVPESAQWLSRALAVAAGIAAAAALVDFYRHPTWDGRLVGLGQLRNSVTAGIAFDAGLIFALNTALTGGKAWRVIGAACAAFAGLAAFATGSRNAYLSGVIGVGMFFFAKHRLQSARGWLLVTVPLLGLIVLVVLVAANSAWTDTLFPRGDSFRLEIWRAEWQRLLSHGPWFGLGILERDDLVLMGQQFAHPHSLYLASAFQGGVVGLLLLLSVLLCAGLILYRARRLPAARMGAALLATGMSAYLFDGWELIDKVGLSWLLLWVPVAIATAVGVMSEMGIPHKTGDSSRVSACIDSIEAQR